MAFFALLCLAGLFAPFMASHDAQFYFDRGSTTLSTTDPVRHWIYHWDLSSAHGDFSHAVKLNPRFAAAYVSRADVELLQGDADAASKDYTAAIGLDPQNPSNYVERARIEVAKRDFDQALGDYAKAIALQPGNRRAHRGRIRVKELQNDFTGAVMERVHMIEEMVPAGSGSTPASSDFFTANPNRWGNRPLRQLDRALETDTNFAWGYFYRGIAESLTNDRDGALADFQRCQSFPDGRVKDYAAIHTWLVQARTGEREKADQGLLAYCQNRKEGTAADWQMHIANFLLNQISETAFSKAIDASDTDREQSEFWYYTGMKRLLADDRPGASDCFQKSLATRTRPYAVFVSAQAELSSLNPAAPAE